MHQCLPYYLCAGTGHTLCAFEVHIWSESGFQTCKNELELIHDKIAEGVKIRSKVNGM